MKYRIIVLSMLLIQSCFAVLYSQSVSESRTLEKSFAVDENMSLDISNKYGKVHYATSSTDSVFIRIEMNASASKQSKLRKLVDGVSFDLTSTNHFVIAETKFNKGPINLIEGIRSLTNNIISSESKLSIDYYIYAPTYLKARIENRYGDVYIESTEADLTIMIVNGDLKAEDLGGQTSFELNFCNATILSLGEAKMDLSYGDLNLTSVESLRLTSASSKIDISDIEELIIESRRDKCFIKGVSSIEGNSYFSDFNIDILREKVNLSSRYGNVNIELLAPTFDIISLESSFTGVFLNASPEASFTFDAKLSNCNSAVPDHWLIEEEALSIEKNEYLYYGEVGPDNTGGKVILKLIRGKLIFDQSQ